MELFKIGFVSVKLLDIIDVSIVSYLFYRLYSTLRGSIAFRIVGLILAIVLFREIVTALDLILLKSILDPFLSLGAIAVLILFAPEIRRFLTSIAKNTIFDRTLRQIASKKEVLEHYKEVIKAVFDLRDKGEGALIVFVGNDPLLDIRETGDMIDAEISSRLIYSIFLKTSPLHDGAMVLTEDKISAVRCILPLAERGDLPAELGLRHRSALGVTEVSDALAIVVSEERGEISTAFRGNLKQGLEFIELEQAILSHLQRLRV